MTKAPERILVDQKKERGFYEPPPHVEYTRSDLHSDLMNAADELAEAGNRIADNAEHGHYSIEDQTRWDNALTAYQQAKEKL